MMPMQQYQPPPNMSHGNMPYYGQPGLAQQTQQIQYQAAPRAYASQDRLPAMPEMMQRPRTASVAPSSSQPVVRGAAPEQADMKQIVPATASWQPIRIPSPQEMGIGATQLANSEIALPRSYDLATVTSWLEQHGLQTYQRQKLAEGYQYSCPVKDQPAIIARGRTEPEALENLVREVIKQKQQIMLSRR
jgi:hypothetical protein